MHGGVDCQVVRVGCVVAICVVHDASQLYFLFAGYCGVESMFPLENVTASFQQGSPGFTHGKRGSIGC